MEADERAYEAAFQAVCQDEEARAGLEAVRRACEDLGCPGRGRVLRQAEGVDLDRLYSQAGYLNVVLREKVWRVSAPT